MSTISDALKKVQRQRMPEVAERVDVPGRRPPPRVERREPFPVGITVAAAVVVLLVVGVLGYVRVRGAFPRSARGAEAASEIVRTSTVQVVVTQTVQAAPPVPTAVPAAPVGTQASAMAGSAGPDTRTTAVEAAASEPAALPADLPVVKGIFYSERAPVAIINDSTCQAGEKVGDYEVGAITPTTVIVKGHGVDYTLRMK